MPSFLHESLVLLFRNRPALAPELIQHALHAALPEFGEIRVESADLTNMKPAEYRADLVVVLRRKKPVLGIVVEVQLARDKKKRFAWPAYNINLRARIQCPVCLLVMTPYERVARWARKSIQLGGGNRWTPWVVGPSGVPEITDQIRAREDPELAVLSAMAHGQHADTAKAVQIASSAEFASKGLDADRGSLYLDLVLHSLSEAARGALKAMDPAKYEYQSEFARRYFSQGKAEGKAEGRADVVLKLLALRFGALPAAVEGRIRSAGIEELEGIADRVLSAQSLDEALATP